MQRTEGAVGETGGGRAKKIAAASGNRTNVVLTLEHLSLRGDVR